jgi:GAF domain-containing protein
MLPESDFMSTPATPKLNQKLDALAASAASAEELMEGVAELLHQNVLRYNWVGFYLLEELPGSEPMLVLGPYRGGMTPHTRIALHQGICGAAASTGETVIVDDVNQDSRYLACSLETKSEIVVPIIVSGNVIGELDIDSHYPAAFGDPDRELCEHAASMVSNFFALHPKR